MNVLNLHNVIAAVCPIHGVDSNGEISFRDEATPEQRLAAMNAVANYDEAAINAERLDKLAAMQTRLETTVNAMNGKYPGMNLAASDSYDAAAEKMLTAGVEWSDVNLVKLIYDIIKDLK